MFGINVSSLSALYQDMRSNGQDRDLFHVKYNQVPIDVFFLIDRKPFELLVGIRGENLAFVTKVHPGFVADSIPDDVFWALCRVLKLKPGKGQFTSQIFLQYIASHAPAHCSHRQIRPEQMSQYYRAESADEDAKMYFCGWRTHFYDNRHVRDWNLRKTAFFFGPQVAAFCRSHNISSAWTEDKRKAMNFNLPNNYFSP